MQLTAPLGRRPGSEPGEAARLLLAIRRAPAPPLMRVFGGQPRVPRADRVSAGHAVPSSIVLTG
jgi:hypothetical protein